MALRKRIWPWGELRRMRLFAGALELRCYELRAMELAAHGITGTGPRKMAWNEEEKYIHELYRSFWGSDVC